MLTPAENQASYDVSELRVYACRALISFHTCWVSQNDLIRSMSQLRAARPDLLLCAFGRCVEVV